MTVLKVSHFVLLVTQRYHWNKRDAFLLAGDSVLASMICRLRVSSGTSWEPFSDSLLGYIFRNWKNLTLQKAWSQYKLGNPPQKNASEWHTQFSLVTQSCPTLCDPMNCSKPGLPVHHQLPEFTQTHIHRVGDAIQPSHPLSSPSPPAPNPSQHQGLFQ